MIIACITYPYPMVWIDSATQSTIVYLVYGLHPLSHLIYLSPNLAYNTLCIIMKCFLDQAIDLIITSATESTPSGLDFRENTYQIPVSVQAQLSAKWIRVGKFLLRRTWNLQSDSCLAIMIVLLLSHVRCARSQTMREGMLCVPSSFIRVHLLRIITDDT